MSDTCKVIAGVTWETLAVFGQSPQSQVYVCTMAGVYAAPTAPLICGAAAATLAGKLAATEAGKEVMTEVTERGCHLIVKQGQILIEEGKKTARSFKRDIREAETTYRALNSADGVRWLMNYLSGR